MKRVMLIPCLLAAVAAHAQAPRLEEMDLVEKSVPDGPVARVNGVSIRKVDFLRLYYAERARAEAVSGKEVPDGERVVLAMWCIGTLIEDELLHQEAKKRKLTTDRAQIEAQWAREFEQIRRVMTEREKRDLGDAEILGNLGYSSREEVLTELERADLIAQMKNLIIKESGLDISEKEVAKVFQENKQSFVRPEGYHLKQIYIRARTDAPTASKDRPAAKKRAEEALGRILSGQSFEGVAKAMSDARDRDKGGDMGILPAQVLPPFYVEAAQTMKVGEVSGIIESELGYHIIQLVDMAPGREASLEQAAPFIKDRLSARKGEEKVREYCDTLIQNGADVQVFLALEETLMNNPDYAELRLR